MDREGIQKALDRFKKHVISQARANLTRGNKNVTKGLYNSIRGTAKLSKNSIEVNFSMEEWGLYQDKGVSGTERKYTTPYKYTSKQPPARVFDKWVVRKGIAPRNKDGTFLNRKSLNFAIARSIYKKGIKPSLFFTKPFEAAYRNLPNELIDVYGLEVADLFTSSLKDIK